MTTGTVQSISSFNFHDTLGNEEKFFPMYRDFMRVNAEQSENIAAVVHSLFLPMNNPKTPKTTATLMKQHAETLVKKWTEDMVESQRIPKEFLKLSGGNPFAAAFKKLIGAVEAGGDLEKLDTISKCEKFRRDANKEKNKQESENYITAEQRSLLIEEGNLEVDSPEFREELRKRVEAITGTGKVDPSKPVDDGEEVNDAISLAMKELESQYRKLAEVRGDAQVLDMITASKRRVEEALQKIADSVKKMVANG